MTQVRSDRLAVGLGDLRIELCGAKDYRAFEAWMLRYPQVAAAETLFRVQHRASGIPYSPTMSSYLELESVDLSTPGQLTISTYHHPRVHSRWTLPWQHCVAFLAGLATASRTQAWRIAHGAGCALDPKRGLLILGESGAGKSTLVKRLAEEQLGDEVMRLGLDETGPWIQGTPIPGELRADHLQRRPLRAILLPVHGTGTAELRPLRAALAAPALMRGLIRIQEADVSPDLTWVQQLLKQVPVFELIWDLSKPLDPDLLTEALS